ncbi:hypothetical protein L6452_43577 [Arctium lappa]|uniref:Uncharacterized protein n=1 Tax=Arctium lappa TaxID=4217 RepID=A0ACB8XE39_ARCLA|nr:hypothetical protein L6452_43577 [Arctium lappa]
MPNFPCSSSPQLPLLSIFFLFTCFPISSFSLPFIVLHVKTKKSNVMMMGQEQCSMARRRDSTNGSYSHYHSQPTI